MDQGMMTVKQLKEYLGIGLRQAYELTRSEGFPALHINNTIRIPRGALEVWIQKKLAKKEAV